MELLNKKQLSELLQNVSVHSFRHNVVALARKDDIVTASEPVTEVAAIHSVIKDMIEGLSECRETLSSWLDPELEHDSANYTRGEELIAGMATLMSALAISTRMSALELGIPLEEVQDVLTALLLKDQDNHEEAVNTVLFGLAPTEENNG